MVSIKTILIVGISLLAINVHVTDARQCYQCKGCKEPYGKPDADIQGTNDNYCW
ncbi:unnamed protein product, partial [Adineta steineri]